ncbi:hypothetical protein SCOR_22420 [Sulfidibacter corallicola]
MGHTEQRRRSGDQGHAWTIVVRGQSWRDGQPCVGFIINLECAPLVRHQQGPCKGHTEQRRVKEAAPTQPWLPGVPETQPQRGGTTKDLLEFTSIPGDSSWTRSFRARCGNPQQPGLRRLSGASPFAVMCRPFRTPAGGAPEARVFIYGGPNMDLAIPSGLAANPARPGMRPGVRRHDPISAGRRTRHDPARVGRRTRHDPARVGRRTRHDPACVEA